MYSTDLRRAACNLYKRMFSLRQVGQLFGIGKSTLQRWVSRGMERRQRTKATPTPILKEYICQQIASNPFVTIKSIIFDVMKNTGVRVSKQLVGAAIRSSGYTRKRCRTKFGSPDSTRIQEFCKKASDIDPNKCIFIDETYVKYEDAPKYGYSLKGERTVKACKRRLPGVTLTMAMTSNGILHETIVKGASNAKLFLNFLDGLRAPAGSTLVMDNVRFHHSKCVSEKCAEKEVRVLYTPPYSPDFNPIENVFGWLKNRWRSSDGKDAASFTKAAPRSIFERCVSRTWKLVRSKVLEAEREH